MLFLDEPTTGLDPQNRANLWEQLRLLREAGTTVFLTTHYLDEADQLCDRVAIVDHGRVIALGSPDALKQRYSADTIAVARGRVTRRCLTPSRASWRTTPLSRPWTSSTGRSG